MRIINLRKEHGQCGKRIAATVIWEDSQRPSKDLYYETDEPFADDLICNPHTFLVAAAMPAMSHGERRIAVDGDVSPELTEGLQTAMALIRHWWDGPNTHIPRIEATGTGCAATGNGRRRAGMFFSGGIDSLATLRKNRLNFPEGHPWSVKDGLLVFGLETEKIEQFRHVLESLNELAARAGLTLIPVYTNVRQLDDDWMFWQHKFQDSVYASVAHAFVKRLSVVSIASTYNVPHMQPDGSHPLLDMNYSTTDLRILHDALNLSRLDKMRIVAEWDLGFQNIRTCNRSDLYGAGKLNCGRCWKCVSAMLAFEALGVLENTRAFPREELTEELLDSVIEIYRSTICFYDELPPLLRYRGRGNLAGVIERKIEEYHSRAENTRVRGILRQSCYEKLKRFDRRYLKGRLRRFVSGRRAGSRS